MSWSLISLDDAFKDEENTFRDKDQIRTGKVPTSITKDKKIPKKEPAIDAIPDEEEPAIDAITYENQRNELRRLFISGYGFYGTKHYINALSSFQNAIRLAEKYENHPVVLAAAWHNKGVVLLALERDIDANAALAEARRLRYKTNPHLPMNSDPATGIPGRG